MSLDKIAMKLEKTLGIANQIVDAQVIEDKPLVVKDNSDIQVVEGTVEDPFENLDKDLVEDYIRAREMLRKLIEKGETALVGILSVASGSDHPRAFEVAATIMKTISEVSKDLIALQKEIRDLREQQSKRGETHKTTVEAGGTVNNIVVFDSTSALSEQLKKLQSEGQFQRPIPK